MRYDVAIVGGGPAGSTCATLLKKYDPSIKVGVFEREVFPRDHIGESQLPLISIVLNEMGVWERVEAANFPIKVGATYRWGSSDDLWAFNFVPDGKLADEARPAQYKGQRTQTAFQVDRAVYDKILLDYAVELGTEVHQPASVAKVHVDGDRVTGLTLNNGEEVQADYFIDASGRPAIIRKALGVGVAEPSSLQNVAFWDYWQNAEWAEEIGVGGTRVQVLSLGYGWIWFIPLGPTRTSIGLVVPAKHYKEKGLKPEELYRRALQEEPRISNLLKNATPEGKFEGTSDWSFLSDRLAGENWFLAGESAGFADPILAAGLTLAHAGAREAAYSILQARKHPRDAEWLADQYDQRNRRRIMQHIRFADYWYTANAHFSDLKEFTTQIAKDAGLDLDPERAFQWLGTGGFVDEDMFVGGLGTFSFNALHQIGQRLAPGEYRKAYGGMNHFKLDLRGAIKTVFPQYREGKIEKIHGYERDGKVLPLQGLVGYLVKGLQTSPEIVKALTTIMRLMREEGEGYSKDVQDRLLETLEALIRDGWVVGKTVDGVEPLKGELLSESPFIQTVS